MNTTKILKEALKGCDREKVAKAINMTKGNLNNMIAGQKPYPPKGETPNVIDRVQTLIEVTSETTGRFEILQYLTEFFGFVMVKNPALEVTDSPAISQISKILGEFAKLIDEIGKANEDGIIEQFEADEIRTKWESCKRAIEEFVLACETGKFNKII
ncbi:hypothetical protein AAEX28_13385 [Lentisphaerota bacterium WC36G]|nr:hypothetical protein LJT99_00140 [Lentisphaerae bacterium WC36]